MSCGEFFFTTVNNSEIQNGKCDVHSRSATGAGIMTTETYSRTKESKIEI